MSKRKDGNDHHQTSGQPQKRQNCNINKETEPERGHVVTCCGGVTSGLETSLCDNQELIADSDSKKLPMMAQSGPQQSTITAHAGGVAVVPQIHSCHIEGSVNINVCASSASGLDNNNIRQPCTSTTNTNTDIQQVSEKIKSKLKRGFGSIPEGNTKKGPSTLLNDIYTKLYIIEGEKEGINLEHEVWDIDSVSKSHTSQDIQIDLNNIFKPLPSKSEDFRLVITKGIAGIGKTVSVHKFIIDWAEGKANQDVDLMIIIPFRDLNNMIDDDESYSLQELLEEFYSELKDLEDPEYYEKCNIIFIFDGLDESTLPLNFHGNKRVSKITKKCSVDVLITNLIQADRLLPSAHIWITSRPAAISKVSNLTQTIHRLTEIQGFSNPQKEEYFRKKILDENLANQVVSHIKSSKSLHIMCHIPVFCWISAEVFSIPKILDAAPENIPTSLTSMYTRFLIYQTQKKNEKYSGNHDMLPLSETDINIIFKLGKFAFTNLEKQKLVFSENDLREHDIDVTDLSVKSGVFTEVVKEEDPVLREKWYSFVHLTMQEYLAAFYVLYSFTSEGSFEMVIRKAKRSRFRFEYDSDCESDGYWVEESDIDDDEYYDEEDDESIGDDSDVGSDYHIIWTVKEAKTLHDLHEAAIDKALRSRNGHLDLFLRFLLGLSMDRYLWGHFRLEPTKDQDGIGKTIELIKTKFKEEGERKLPSPERCINLLHCLTELKDDSIMREIHWLITSQNSFIQKISTAECTALAYIITTSDEVMEEFDLRKYKTSEEGLDRLIVVLGKCVRAKLGCCPLTAKCLESVLGVLQSTDSHLRELDLSHNKLWVPALKILADGLKSPQCSLTHLDLSFVDLKKAGLMLLDAILLGPHQQPHTLRLNGCGLNWDICDTLARAMERPSAQLKILEMSYNPLTDGGVEKILQGILSKTCVLEGLRLCACYITETSCATLAKVLQQSKLKQLDLSGNNLGDKGLKLVCIGLMSPLCRLQTLGLRDCNLYKGSCAALAPVLWSFSDLRELDLSDNDLPVAGLKLLSVGLRNPRCSLRVLRMSGCQITERGCALLASALIRNPHHLEELDLSYNHLGESGMQQLSAKQKDQHFNLQELNMKHNQEYHLKWGFKKYAVDLTCIQRSGVDLSEDRKTATRSRYLDRFCSPFEYNYWYLDDGMLDRGSQDSQLQVECDDPLSGGRFYWEVDWTGVVSIGVKHWSETYTMRCPYRACLGNTEGAFIPKHVNHIQRIGVYLDWPAGTLSFYNLSFPEKMFLHTIKTTFNTPVIPFFSFEKPFSYATVSSITIRTLSGARDWWSLRTQGLRKGK